jgi:Putative zinc ribbon domain
MQKNMEQICQSCAMPMAKEGDFGTMADGSKNEEYCRYCFQNGRFTSSLTKAEMIEKLAGMSDKMGMTREEARKTAGEVISTLKRWR